MPETIIRLHKLPVFSGRDPVVGTSEEIVKKYPFIWAINTLYYLRLQILEFERIVLTSSFGFRIGTYGRRNIASYCNPLFAVKKYGVFTLWFCSFFLIILGALAAKVGGSSIIKAIVRITFWGAVAMGLTALVGYLFNVNVRKNYIQYCMSV